MDVLDVSRWQFGIALLDPVTGGPIGHRQPADVTAGVCDPPYCFPAAFVPAAPISASRLTPSSIPRASLSTSGALS